MRVLEEVAWGSRCDSSRTLRTSFTEWQEWLRMASRPDWAKSARASAAVFGGVLAGRWIPSAPAARAMAAGPLRRILWSG